MKRLVYPALVVLLAVGIASCGQDPTLAISFNETDCSMNGRAINIDEPMSIWLLNESGQDAWFGIGLMRPDVTLDQMVQQVETSGSKTEAVLGLFDPAGTVYGNHVPDGATQVNWGQLTLEPGIYSVWCTQGPAGRAETAGTFERSPS